MSADKIRERSRPLRQSLSHLKYLAIGAGMMYVLDPDRGHRRRKLFRDLIVRKAHEAWHEAGKIAVDVANRSRGLAARARSVVIPDNADDWILRERVRSAIGRVNTHPSAISVISRDLNITLRGPILESEVDDLLAAVRQVRGVRGITNLLEIHRQPDQVPELQGQGRLPASREPLMHSNRRPAIRLLMGSAGAAAAVWGLSRRRLPGTAIGLGGAAVLLRSISSVEIGRSPELGADRHAVIVRKTITIGAPIDRVFDFFGDYTRFPHFMTNVREVRPLGSDRSRWVVAGPMGVPISWDAQLTCFVPGEVIGWHSLAGARIENAGSIRFQQRPQGTRVDIQFAYVPPGGAIGHLAARLFGADPKHEMDADLARVKRTLESAHPKRDSARTVKEEIIPT